LEFKQTESSQNIKIPLDFVINKISWSYVKVKWIDWKIKFQKVVLWEVDAGMVEVISGLNVGEIICY
jgi:hypothetical protein